jgi:Mce-associated membrane protein
VTRRTTTTLAAVAAVLAMLTTALAAVAVTRLSTRHATATARTQALAAAGREVGAALSYNYKTLTADVARAEAQLTPRFRSKYKRTFASVVTPLAAKYKAVSQAVVTGAGVVSADPDRVEVLVAVSQTSSNTQVSAPRLDRSRIDVTLRRVGNRWLIDALQPI